MCIPLRIMVDVMLDSLVCGSCGRVFSLNSLNEFIEHKAQSCKKSDVVFPQFMQCYHCDVRTISAIDLILHAKVTHGINILKDSQQTVIAHQLAIQQSENESNTLPTHLPSTDYNTTNDDNSFRETPPDASVEQNGFLQKHSTESVPSLTPESNSIPPEDLNFCAQKVIRKTCCLVDGGAPCDQFTDCPILDDVDANANWQPTDSETQESLPESLTSPVFDNSINKSTRHSLSITCSNSNHVRKFQCDLCSQRFTQKVHLQKHTMSKHSRNWPFKCTQCEYRTVESSHLKAHFRRHTGERPFTCQQCNYKAAQHSTLKQHCLKKHRNYFLHCEDCNGQFVTLNELDKHKKFCASRSY